MTFKLLPLFVQGIAGHGYYGNCVVPIIENTARECELTGTLANSNTLQNCDVAPPAEAWSYA